MWFSMRSKYFTRYLKLLLTIATFTGILLVMIWARAYYGAMQNCQEGIRFFERNEYIRAVTYFDRSLHWYTPCNPYIQKSAEMLWKLGTDARDKGNIRLALIATRTIRRGFISARSFYTPGTDWIHRCDLRIQGLLKPRTEKNDEFQIVGSTDNSSLEHPPIRDPDIFWSIALLIGLLGWIGSIMALIISRFRIVANNGIFNFFTFKWGILWVVFFVIWIVGMIKA